MKAMRKPFHGIAILLMLVLAISCSKGDNIEPIAEDPCKTNPCGNPEQCLDQCDDENPTDPSGITEDDLEPEGDITETENGYLVEGSLTMNTDSGEPIVFAEADLDVQFNDDGTLKSMSGTTEIPAPTNYFEFETPVQADIGFFTGKFLNENRDFEIQLVDERSYFVFAISAGLELKLGVNDDPDAHKPLSIEAPVGGHITYIADYTDPMFFFSLGGDALGGGDGGDNNNGGSDGDSSHNKLSSVSFGASFGSNFMYVPTNPVEGNVVTFQANQVTGGTVSFFKILEASGMYYQNRGFSADLNFDEPMESDFGVNYRSGINGQLDLSLDITSFISFGFPIGSGSAAVVAEASTNDGVVAKAFINGLVDPDLSWWPNFIPLMPDGDLNAYGFVEQTGNFDIGMSGSFEIQMPTGDQSMEGAVRATPEAFTMEGQVVSGDDVWGASAVFTTSETKCIATTPDNFTDGISETVTEQIDAAIATTEQAIQDLQDAEDQYELELSLRGLRAALPGIIDQAQDAIDDAVAAGLASGRSTINSYLSDYDRILCSDNLSGQIDAIVRGHRNALTRLRNAVSETNDNATTRAELEGALRDLASLDRINRTFSVTIIHGHKTFGCGDLWTMTATRSVTINETILTSGQKAQLLEAADNVKYIEEADGIRIEAQDIVDQLPTVEELESLKDNVEACVQELTNGIGGAGFVYNHDTEEFTHFVIINGEEKEVGTFNIFSKNELIETSRAELDGCDPNDALNKLFEDAKSR
ncbi:hypothetical protein [Flagellimonas iocasae]|uniref:Uncharacterized protein n=1 Tax=Flagellimonas iocasae TaxID=2055905 RepID=A0ABW4XVM3_9FLAO